MFEEDVRGRVDSMLYNGDGKTISLNTVNLKILIQVLLHRISKVILHL